MSCNRLLNNDGMSAFASSFLVARTFILKYCPESSFLYALKLSPVASLAEVPCEVTISKVW